MTEFDKEKFLASEFGFGLRVCISYHFTRTDEYYGICTQDETDWLLKCNRC